ncbi:MAG TPA: hypothetical protein VMW46_04160 [Candidatus Desulfaltia sp.]|nr:hypothetical protein [Candidatus Desulfaltia sp.]
MIEKDIWVLAGTAATLGFVHTVIGPDHYLPFIVISRARRWSLTKTLLISFFCGLGHVLSSVVLGFVGIALGIAVARLEGVESARGNLAAWLLISFGFAYFVWGLWRALKKRPHAMLIPTLKPGSTPTPTSISPITIISMAAGERPPSHPGSSSSSLSSGLASRSFPSSCTRLPGIIPSASSWSPRPLV